MTLETIDGSCSAYLCRSARACALLRASVFAGGGSHSVAPTNQPTNHTLPRNRYLV